MKSFLPTGEFGSITFERTRQESLVRRKTIASLCNDLLVSHIDDLDKG
ncbi:MAG: hypothetical protein ABI690_00380 [Chloroflexota bacterium]